MKLKIQRQPCPTDAFASQVFSVLVGSQLIVNFDSTVRAGRLPRDSEFNNGRSLNTGCETCVRRTKSNTSRQHVQCYKWCRAGTHQCGNAPIKITDESTARQPPAIQQRLRTLILCRVLPSGTLRAAYWDPGYWQPKHTIADQPVSDHRTGGDLRW